MRYSFYSLIIFAAFTGIFYYLLGSLSPWNEVAVNQTIERFDLLTNKEFTEFVREGVSNGTIFNLLDIKNLVILFLIGLLAFVAGFSSIHLFVDKLFFKKFYENPSIFNAVRRGLFLGLILISFATLRLIGAFQLYTVLLGLTLVVLLELFFVFFLHHKHPNGQREEHLANSTSLPSPISK